MSARPILALVLIAACDSGTTTSTDAPTTSKQDAPATAVDGHTADSATSNVCTGMLYDSCNAAASNCATGTECHAYGSSGFSVCIPSAACSTANPCPTQGGAAVTCNNMGKCKPTAPNTDCTSP